MLAIQNQISVLSKILATKIQHQQILEHQQAVSASLKKATTPVPARSRKTSANQDAGQEKTGGASGSGGADKMGDVPGGLGDGEGAPMGEVEDSIIPESTGCIVS